MSLPIDDEDVPPPTLYEDGEPRSHSRVADEKEEVSQPEEAQAQGRVVAASIIAKESKLDTVIRVLAGIGSFTYAYLPEAVKEVMPKPAPAGPEDEAEVVLSAVFQWLPAVPNEPEQILLGLVYERGYQVWRISQLDAAVEVVSTRVGSYSSLLFLPLSVLEHVRRGPLRGEFPLIALVSSSSPAVSIKSLANHSLLHTVVASEPVLGVKAARDSLFLIHSTSIAVVNLESFQQVASYGTFPQFPHRAVVALGSRWLAYPSVQTPLPPRAQAIAMGSYLATAERPASTLVRNLTETLAAEVGSSLIHLGEASVKSVSALLSPNPSPPVGGTPSPAAVLTGDLLEKAGVVCVVDIVTGKKIAHFRAHRRPISLLEFNPSGSLLATVSDGHSLHLYQVTPLRDEEDATMAFRRIYTLKRGYTDAEIQSIAFSPDARWMCISSGHGTTHVFAINPTGGPVSARTHLPADLSGIPIVSYLNEFRNPYPRPEVDLVALHRLKHEVVLSETAAAIAITTSENTASGTASSSAQADSGVPSNGRGHEASLQGPPLPLFCAFGSPYRRTKTTPQVETVFCLTPDGRLTHYILRPLSGKAAGSDDPAVLGVKVEAIFRWETTRRESWAPSAVPLETANPLAASQSFAVTQVAAGHPSWLPHIELCTHEPEAVALWGLPQFTFATYDAPPLSSASTASGALGGSGGEGRSSPVPSGAGKELASAAGLRQLIRSSTVARGSSSPRVTDSVPPPPFPTAVFGARRERVPVSVIDIHSTTPHPVHAADDSHLFIELSYDVGSAPTLVGDDHDGRVLEASLMAAMEEDLPPGLGGKGKGAVTHP